MYEAVIGLEVHAQLSTESKIFATSSGVVGKEPNSLTDPVVLGLPGALPVLNRRAVDFAIKIGLATNCEIAKESIFARKHYFYPDLPKGYQISQFDRPVCVGGRIEIRIGGSTKVIGLTRIHLEEDAGKSSHSDTDPVSFVDLNRAGVPLVEIVSEPDLRSAEEAGAYMRQLRQILRYLEICDGNMEEGSLRCDANVSVRKHGETTLGTKVEIKNLNSFRFVEKAIAYEITRQTMLCEQGETITQETRLWDEQKSTTRVMRSKEQAEDYRYFPDPDLLPLVIESELVEKTRASLPELPQQVFSRFKRMYGLDDYYCDLLTDEKLTAGYYDQAVSAHHNPAALANWITTELFGRLNKEGLTIATCPISPAHLAALVKLIDEDVISGKIAKSVFEEMFETGASPLSVVEEKGLRQVSDTGYISAMIEGILESHPEQVQQYREGKTKMFGFFVGQIMKVTEGKANPRVVNDLLTKLLAGEPEGEGF